MVDLKLLIFRKKEDALSELKEANGDLVLATAENCPSMARALEYKILEEDGGVYKLGNHQSVINFLMCLHDHGHLEGVAFLHEEESMFPKEFSDDFYSEGRPFECFFHYKEHNKYYAIACARNLDLDLPEAADLGIFD